MKKVVAFKSMINAGIGVMIMEIVLIAIMDMLFIKESVFFHIQLLTVSKTAQNPVKESTVVRKTLLNAKAHKVIVNAPVTTLAIAIHAKNAKKTIKFINGLTKSILTIALSMNMSTKWSIKSKNLGFWDAKKSALNASTRITSIVKMSAFPILTNASAQILMEHVSNVKRGMSQTKRAFA